MGSVYALLLEEVTVDDADGISIVDIDIVYLLIRHDHLYEKTFKRSIRFGITLPLEKGDYLISAEVFV